MGNDQLRRELDKIASDEDVPTHTAKITDLSARFDCSISPLPDYKPGSGNRFNCYEYALGLNVKLHYSTTVTLADQYHVLADNNFIKYLDTMGLLKKKSLEDMTNGDLVIYFKYTQPKHAGIWHEGRVKSKWGSGLLYEHGLYVTPLQYGEPSYYEAITSDVAKDCFLEYAKQQGVPDEELQDA